MQREIPCGFEWENHLLLDCKEDFRRVMGTFGTDFGAPIKERIAACMPSMKEDALERGSAMFHSVMCLFFHV